MLVSVIIPIYNGEKFIDASIRSIQEQTYSKLEIIIIDDGSVDRSVKLVKNLMEKDARIKLYQNPTNQGITASLNRGLSLARGNIISRHDIDELADPTKIERSINKLLAAKTKNIIVCESYKRNVQLFLSCTNVIKHPSVMFFKSEETIYNEIFKLAQDYELWLRLRNLGWSFQKLENLTYSIPNCGSVSILRSAEQRYYAKLAQKMHFKIIDRILNKVYQFLRSIRI